MDDQTLKKLCQDIITKFAETKSLEKIKSARILFNFYSKLKRRTINIKINIWSNQVKKLTEREQPKNKINQNASFNANINSNNFTNNLTNMNSMATLNTINSTQNIIPQITTNLGFGMRNDNNQGNITSSISVGAGGNQSTMAGKIRKTSQAIQANLNKNRRYHTSESSSIQNEYK